MSRRRERANFDGSVSLVRQTHPETPGEDAEATLIRLAKIMEMADDTLNAVWRDSERKQGREKERQKDLDDMQKQLPSSKDPVSETGDGISSILESLKNTNRYGFWCGAVSVCTSSIGEADGKVGIAENLAALWKEAVSTFDRLPDAHGPKFPFGAAVNVAVLMKIRAIEPVVLELVAWSPWTHWRQEIPDSACVTEGLRAKAKEIQQVHYKQRMEELHRPDLGSLIAVQSTLTTAVISTIFCATAFLGVAWHYSTPDIGSPHDMDLWFVIQACALSVLGYFTTMFPLYHRAWGSPWHWSQVFCAVGALCSLGSIPAFLLAPKFWSAALSFIGAASQAVITLQLSILAMQPEAARKKQD